jgi:hypothetical protein
VIRGPGGTWSAGGSLLLDRAERRARNHLRSARGARQQPWATSCAKGASVSVGDAIQKAGRRTLADAWIHPDDPVLRRLG